MPKRLREEEVVTIRVLAEKGQNHCEIARTVGVTESTVRYHLRRAAEGAGDGRHRNVVHPRGFGRQGGDPFWSRYRLRHGRQSGPG